MAALGEDVTTTFKLSLMQGILPEVRVAEVYWKDFVDLLKEHSSARTDETSKEKRRAPSFSCCEYYPPHRLKENVRSMWAVVLDLDEVYDGKAVRAILKKWTYVAWTTWSSTKPVPRWRIVLPVRGGLSGEEELGKAIDHLTGLIKSVRGAKVDRCSRDIAHLWFMPWHPQSTHDAFRLWENADATGFYSIPRVIQVDFTDVPSRKPDHVEPGERNVALHRFLGELECLRSKTFGVLVEKARAFNSSMPYPLKEKEVREIARKKWKWMTTDANGVRLRGSAMRGEVAQIEEDAARDLDIDEMMVVKQPVPLLGDFLYPGVTLISAKMKEGKSFLTCQLAVAVATGETFLNGPKYPGFSVLQRKRVVVVAGEDSPELIAARYGHNMAAGNLPRIESGMISVAYADDLFHLKQKYPDTDGLVVLEQLIDRWYKSGHRLICLDPLRVAEAMLGIGESSYPGSEGVRNAHTRDLLTTAYFHRLAMRYGDLCILMSLHHGKNKRDHDSQDPGDMVAGTTGLGAGAGATISILPCPPEYTKMVENGDEVEENGPKRRELYIHGRVVRESRLLIEQDVNTGLWRCLGSIADQVHTMTQTMYLAALDYLMKQNGGDWVPAEAIAKHCKVHPSTVAKSFGRAIRNGAKFQNKKRLVSLKSRGYRLLN